MAQSRASLHSPRHRLVVFGLLGFVIISALYLFARGLFSAAWTLVSSGLFARFHHVPCHDQVGFQCVRQVSLSDGLVSGNLGISLILFLYNHERVSVNFLLRLRPR